MAGKCVWILNHYAITPDMAGETRHFDLGKDLVKRGYQVVIFASGFDYVSRKFVKVDPKEQCQVFSTVCVASGSGGVVV